MIASITMTRNDWHMLEQWKCFSEKYAEVFQYQIIVDNASEPQYCERLRKLFPDAVLLERPVNGGTTGAYNTGISWVLKNHPEVDAIFLIAADIHIESSSVEFLYKQLKNHEDCGAVAPVLLQKDLKTINAYGEVLREDLTLGRLHDGELFQPELLPAEQEAQCLPGGICMVKTEVYRKVGLQDESLFMYSDENDFFFRTRQSGYRLFAFRDAVAVHCHITTEGKANDSGLAWFYIVRNQLLLCRRYASGLIFTKMVLKKIFWYGPKQCAGFLLKEHCPKKVWAYYCGFFCGIFNIVSNNTTN